MRAWTVTGLGLAGLSAAAVWAFDAPKGYLAGQPPIDYKALLGDPPAPGSPGAVAERADYVANAKGIGGPAWKAGISQLYPGSVEVLAQAACAVGRRLAPDTTPLTIRLLANLSNDIGPPVGEAKKYWHRDRPFVGQTDARTCDPRSATGTAANGDLSFSYPSGHAAYGEMTGRALAAMAPDHAASALAWGKSVGNNRVACRVHWPSDVAAGQKLADAIYDRVAATPGFQADLKAARAELAGAAAATGCES